jgi:hypothetical protein
VDVLNHPALRAEAITESEADALGLLWAAKYPGVRTLPLETALADLRALREKTAEVEARLGGKA